MTIRNYIRTKYTRAQLLNLSHKEIAKDCRCSLSYVSQLLKEMGIPSRARRRGFAVISREKRRKIASMGGKAAQKKGTAHRYTSEEARKAVQIRLERNGR